FAKMGKVRLLRANRFVCACCRRPQTKRPQHWRRGRRERGCDSHATPRLPKYSGQRKEFEHEHFVESLPAVEHTFCCHRYRIRNQTVSHGAVLTNEQSARASVEAVRPCEVTHGDVSSLLSLWCIVPGGGGRHPVGNLCSRHPRPHDQRSAGFLR